ncbi:MAG: VCBS repeat-containing protein, partial [Phycisphaerales bacterium]|nr:VCBS repeat-containing protein [Phycisphaerales bacterium]
DGDLDILAIGDITFVLYTNDGSGQFTKSIIPSGIITENYAFDVADINNDGFVDAIIAGVKTYIYINNTDNTFTYNPTISASLFDIPSLSFSVLAKDFDHDGDQDLIIGDTNHRGYWWYEQQSNGLFTLRQIISTGIPQSHSLAAADFDNDGHLDLITNFPQLGQTVWFKGNGAGDFENAALIHQGFSPAPQHVATGDFNNDGIADAVWSIPLSVHLSTATVCVADLTGDGALNILDIFAFLDLFGTQDPLADMTGDGAFNILDIFAFLGIFGLGCP